MKLKNSLKKALGLFIFALIIVPVINVNATTVSDIKIGDYISYSSPKDTYEISSSITNYKDNQTIYPSELDLWRVIKINDDGSIDIVSENVSSSNVYIRGINGYLSYVATLNEIAEQYVDSTYASQARILGYSNQAGRIYDFVSDRGDEGYTSDTDAVTNIYGSLTAKTVNGNEASYWLSSRQHVYWSAFPKDCWYGRIINASGNIDRARLIDVNLGVYIDAEAAHAIRPVVTLNNDIAIKRGNGTQGQPYQLMSINTEASANGKIEYSIDENNVVSIIINADKGYELDTLSVKGSNGALTVTNNTFTLPSDGVATITATFKPINYQFTDGKDATYQGTDLVFTLNGDYDLVDKVLINGKELDSSNYTITEGSTVLTLKKEYLKTVKAGTYELTVTYTNGSSDTTTFTIEEQKDTTTPVEDENVNTNEKNEIKNPNTFDGIVFYVGLGIVSIMILTSTGIYIKKYAHKETR